MHYGITYNVDEYAFDKHWYMGSDFTSCPGRIFNKPMLPEELHNKPGSMEYRRKTVALTVASSLYEATKWWSGYHCNHTLPDPPKQSYSCTTMSNGVVSCREIKDEKAQIELIQRLRSAGLEDDHQEVCKEENNNCCNWAANGECVKNPSFMLGSCQRSCNLCGGGCREGCCPPKVALEEKKNMEEEDMDSEKDDGISPPSLQMPPPPPPINMARDDDAGKSRKREDASRVYNVESTFRDEETEEEEEVDEEEDYDDQNVTSSSLRAVYQWTTLLAFGSGAMFTLFFLKLSTPDSTRFTLQKMTRGRENKTAKGSQ